MSWKIGLIKGFQQYPQVLFQFFLLVAFYSPCFIIHISPPTSGMHFSLVKPSWMTGSLHASCCLTAWLCLCEEEKSCKIHSFRFETFLETDVNKLGVLEIRCPSLSKIVWPLLRGQWCLDTQGQSTKLNKRHVQGFIQQMF